MEVKVFILSFLSFIKWKNSPKNLTEDLNLQTNMQNWDSKYDLSFHETFISNFKFEIIKDFSCTN